MVRVRRRRRTSSSTSHKRKKRQQRHSRWWFVLPVVGGVVLLVGIAGALLLRDALEVRESLQGAQASLQEVRTAAGSVEIEAAAAALDDADRQLADARSRSGGPLWSFGSYLPVVGDSVDLTRATVNLASAAVAVADTAVHDGEDLVTRGLDIQVDDGSLDLAPLAQAGQLLDSLPVERLADARDRLADMEPSWAPDELIEGRETSLELANDAIATIENGRTLLDALPGFLGAEEPRSYFLGVQTPAELRGTGGMIGYWAVLEFDDGQVSLDDAAVHDPDDAIEGVTLDGGSFELTRSEVHEALSDGDEGPTTDRVGALGGDIEDGATVDEEFGSRYEHVAAAGHFSNVNVDPDLPTTASVALDLYERRVGDRLDGMILVDPIAMQFILEAVGADLDVPADAVAGGAPETVEAGQFAEYVLVDVYEQFGQGESAQRKNLLRSLGDSAFERVFDGRWDGGAIARAIGDASGARHLQVFSRDEQEQASFVELGVAGHLQAPDGADLLAVTANNAVGGKQDVHVGHNVTADVRLDDPRRTDDGEVTVSRAAEVRVEVDNPLPTEGMNTYILGSCVPRDGASGCFDGPPGQNRTWFSVWAPGGSNLQGYSGDDGGGGLIAGQLRGLNVYDRYVTTPSQQRSGFEVVYDGRAPAAETSGELRYELAWWGQAKAVPTRLDVTFTPPEGWRVAEVEVAGPGTDAPVLFGETEELSVEAGDDGSSRVTGTLSGDATLQVTMEGA
jgi:hypothetical protein